MPQRVSQPQCLPLPRRLSRQVTPSSLSRPTRRWATAGRDRPLLGRVPHRLLRGTETPGTYPCDFWHSTDTARAAETVRAGDPVGETARTGAIPSRRKRRGPVHPRRKGTSSCR